MNDPRLPCCKAMDLSYRSMQSTASTVQEVSLSGPSTACRQGDGCYYWALTVLGLHFWNEMKSCESFVEKDSMLGMRMAIPS